MGSFEDIFYKGTVFEKPKTVKKDYYTVTGENENLIPDPQRGDRLHSIYAALKGFHEGNRFRQKSKNKTIILIFNKVAGRLNEVERRTGVEIKDVLFVATIFRKFGRNTYPGHLLAAEAINIYNEGLGEFVVQHYYPKKDPDQDQDKKMLEYLCEVREQSPEEVMACLKDARIFSPEFVKKFEKGKGR